MCYYRLNLKLNFGFMKHLHILHSDFISILLSLSLQDFYTIFERVLFLDNVYPGDYIVCVKISFITQSCV